MIQQALDGASIVGVIWLLRWLNHDALGLGYVASSYLNMVFALLAVLALSYDHFAIYRSNASASLKAISLFKAWTVAFLVLLAIGFVTKQTEIYSRFFISQIYVVGFVTQLLLHLTVRYFYQRYLKKNEQQENVLIIGQSRLAHFFQNKISNNPWLSEKVVGYVNLPGDQHARRGRKSDPQILGKLNELVEIVDQHEIHKIYIVTPFASTPKVEKIFNQLLEKQVAINWIPDIFSLRLINHSMKEISGIPIITLSETPLVGVRLLAKSLEDKFLSAIILLMISPILLCIAIAIKLDSAGPVFFRQNRTGWNGKSFKIFKFRSMYVHQPESGVVKQAAKGDPRITRVGGFLRRTSLDELPQLFNVLLGDMSLVGPRPHAIQHDEEYSERVYHYFARHHIKPGITGLAQVRGLRGETKDIDQMIQRVESDIEYINNWSVSLDLSIILRTVFAFTGKNAY